MFVLPLQILEHAPAAPVAAPAALQHQNASTLCFVQLQAQHVRATGMASHDRLQLQCCVRSLVQLPHITASLVAANLKRAGLCSAGTSGGNAATRVWATNGGAPYAAGQALHALQPPSHVHSAG